MVHLHPWPSVTHQGGGKEMQTLMERLLQWGFIQYFYFCTKRELKIVNLPRAKSTQRVAPQSRSAELRPFSEFDVARQSAG